MDTTHLSALELRLSHERAFMFEEKTEAGKWMRSVWMKQIEKEIAEERKFLGLKEQKAISEISNDELRDELLG